MSSAAKVIRWNGRDLPDALRDLPDALRDLPPGEYTLERVETAAEAGLTPEQEAGILRAMDSADRGELRPWDEVRARLEARLNVRRAG